LPCITVAELGVAERLKSGPCTTNVTVVECDNVPLVPVIVRGYVPTAVVDAVTTVNVEFPELVSDAGLKLAVTPAGKPLTLKLAVPVNPFSVLSDVV